MGIIPALAGNTNSAVQKNADVTDHPRSRGEYTPRPVGLLDASGIIPALAGNTRAVRHD